MESAAEKVLELVVFKLNDGGTREELLATVDPVSEWIREQPGFISRDLSYDPEGDRWIDLIWWRTLQDAKAAAELAMASAACRPMFALIDMESTLMVHGVPAIAPVHA
ncbi:MAG TPA: hypothetical protein VF715_10885 [Thermoleophilaceae bacterium]|jgi:antibiotic biosynthesis monooxygenase (ABM) superfamily enzyme